MNLEFKLTGYAMQYFVCSQDFIMFRTDRVLKLRLVVSKLVDVEIVVLRFWLLYQFHIMLQLLVCLSVQIVLKD